MENVVTAMFPVPIGTYMGKNPMKKSEEGHGSGFSGGFGSIQGSGYGERIFSEALIFAGDGDGSGDGPGKGCILGTGIGTGGFDNGLGFEVDKSSFSRKVDYDLVCTGVRKHEEVSRNRKENE